MKLIPLSHGCHAKVDDADYDWLMQWKWSCSVIKGNHRATRTDRSQVIPKMIYMSVAIIAPSPGYYVDHANRDTLDNRRSNLRQCTNSQNNANTRKRTTRKYRGVYWNEKRGKYYADIRVNGKTIHLGGFVNADDAALAYNRAAVEIHGEFASLNEVM